MSFKLTVKKGKQEYKLSAKSGTYKYKSVDDVRTFDELAEALAEFLYTVIDESNEDEVRLSYNPSKKK